MTPLNYTLVITGAPWSSQTPQSALAFARELLVAGHRIDRVFLYGEGVLLASALAGCRASLQISMYRSCQREIDCPS